MILPYVKADEAGAVLVRISGVVLTGDADFRRPFHSLEKVERPSESDS
ncbi:MAG: hypothetical protein EOR30_29940 [Mesorhizobium sp.]|nr:MAG: hypothetical protein EOR14_31605 [Mesorhizobium sp.]RWI63182.1 MAG: hypothetical protein EOR17_29665 [Mesorhizobium sp.]RWI82503.1 MAG: hypothetical protein EOR20_26740 [Mesorhizobium sp.]RWJ43934.1 MAG: hypothetical protein EOR30_29940 [Mesorhizobium sp.]RWJ57442.1 MAG: hypothetical protein EOR32_29870 [Mesorhizobium sp.]